MSTKTARATLKTANAETFISRAIAIVKAALVSEAQARDALKSADAIRFAGLAAIVHESGTAFTALELQRIWTDAGGKLGDASAATYASQLGMAARLSKTGKELPENLKTAKSKAAAVEALTGAVKAAGLKSAKGRKAADDGAPKATSPKDASPEERKAARALLADAVATLAALGVKFAANGITCGNIAAKTADLEAAMRLMMGGIDDANSIDAKGKSE